MDTTTEARQLVEIRLKAIDEEKARLERAIAALSVSTPRKPRATPKRRVAKGGKTRAKRGQRPAEILEFISKNKETTATLVAESLGVATGQVNGVVSRLRKEGKVAKGTPLRVTQRAS